MKTTTPVLYSMLAAIAAAGAQDAPPAPTPPNAPPPPPSPAITIHGAAAGASAGSPAAEFSRAYAGLIEVPAVRAEQIAEPVRWNFRTAGDLSEFPLADRKGPVTYLGVSASPPPSELAPHLPIDEDTGLVIEFLAKDGPAAQAGLLERDVLAKLDDQILIHPRQLAVLVANHKEGDKVKISYVRKGQLQEATAVLAKKEQPKPLELRSEIREGANPDVMFYGQAGSPLKTFVRRIQLNSGDAGAGTIEMGEIANAIPGVPGAEPAPAPATDAKAELEAIRKMLEDLTKRLEEKK